MSIYPDGYRTEANWMEAELSPREEITKLIESCIALADDRTASQVRKELLDVASLLRGFEMNNPTRTLTDGGWTLDQVIEQIEAMAGQSA